LSKNHFSKDARNSYRPSVRVVVRLADVTKCSFREGWNSMKHLENTLIRFGLAVTIAFGIWHASSMAQEEKPANTAVASTSPVAKGPYAEELALAIRIEQCKVDITIEEPIQITDFVTLIQDQVPHPLNIIVSRNTASVSVPSMKLKQVSVFAALEAVILATENEILWDNDAEEVIAIRRNDGYFDEAKETVTVVNVSEILEDTEEASLLSAIEIGLDMRNSSKKNVTIKLHKETKLLFVKGIRADLDVVMQIVSELGGKPWPPVESDGGGFGGGLLGGAGVEGGGGKGGGTF